MSTQIRQVNTRMIPSYVFLDLDLILLWRAHPLVGFLSIS